MTTRYTRNRLNILSSLASDYSRPRTRDEWEMTFSTLDEVVYQVVECAAGVALTLTTSHLTDVPWFAIYNEGTANYVTVAWTNNAIANQQQIAFGGMMYVGGSSTTPVLTVASNISITANTTSICRVYIGAT